MNIVLSVLPFVFGAVMMVKKALKKKVVLAEYPTIYLIVPVYNEIPEILNQNIEAIMQSNYPNNRIHLVLAFDDDSISRNFVLSCRKFKFYTSPSQANYPKLIDTEYNEMKISICRFQHEGKRITQMNAYKHLYQAYNGQFEDNSLIFFIDSDIILRQDAITNMVWTLKEGNYSALTGFILINQPNYMIEKLQEVEYLQGQIFHRYFEGKLGGLTCLPGALTVINFKTFKSAANDYFDQASVYEDVRNYHQFYLGEDRFLTYLLLKHCGAYKLGFCHLSDGKTDAPKTLSSLVIQRRRWLLGTISNDAHILCTIELWCSMPLLMFFTLLNSSRDTGWILFAIYVVMPLLLKPLYIVLLFSFLPVVLMWTLVSISAISSKRVWIIPLYPISQIFNQLLSFFIAAYSLFTYGKRSWGGPREDENVLLNRLAIDKLRRSDPALNVEDKGQTSDVLFEIYKSYGQ